LPRWLILGRQLVLRLALAYRNQLAVEQILILGRQLVLRLALAYRNQLAVEQIPRQA
jgi:hypothetical protein